MVDIDAALRKLTLEEKVTLVSGESLWRTFPIDGAAVPVLKVSDGPNGVRGDGGVSAASFPVGICMASTWNTDLLQRVGDAIAEEALSKDVQVVLGPTINIHRTPLGGRNFECYSEDPLLSGTLAAAFISGVQRKGVGACLKHYVCNDSEFERHTISVEVDERTLREIYLKPFEIAIKASHPWTIMAAYNRINGTYACSHDHLINQVLKGEWEYDGLVISDWFAAKETVANALGGLDLEMPGPTRVWGKALLEAVRSGDVAETLIDDKVMRLLRVIDRTHRFERPDEKPEQGVDKPEHRQTAYQAAAEGMVLLKNNGVLPLAGSGLKKLAVIGPNAAEFRIMGGGSSALKPHYIASIFDAIAEKMPGVEVVTAPGCTTHKFIPEPDSRLLSPEAGSGAHGLQAQFFEEKIGSSLVAERVIRSSTVHVGGLAAGAMSASLEGLYNVTESGEHEFGLLSTGKARLTVNDELLIDNWNATEPGEAFFTQATTEKRNRISLTAGEDTRLKIEFEVDPGNTFRAFRYGILPPQPEDAIADAVALAGSADAVMLMVGTNDDWETEGNDRVTLALPGAQDELIARVLAANEKAVVVNNSGSPVDMPWLTAAPAVIQSWFAGQESANALIDIVSGVVNPSGKLPI
ncbi:MAG: glycoside hydrolase family 3 C-terminal domain-containing protein, partial [Pseudomonadales bacterium]